MKDASTDHYYERVQYSLLIETRTLDMQGAYEDDKNVVLGGHDVGGCLVVYVNGSPDRMHYRGSGVFPIYDLLQPGENSVRIVGKHSERMFAKVLTVDPRRFKETFGVEEVLAKTWLDPKEESVVLRFTARVPKGPDWEEVPGWPKEEEKLTHDIHRLVSEWVAAWERHDPDAFFRSMVPELKNAPPYLKTLDAVKRSSAATINFVKDKDNHVRTTPSDVKMIFGKRSVIVYAGVRKDWYPYLFEFRNREADEPGWIGAVTLGRLEGQWVLLH
jgi:hypothetical protein